MFCSCITAEIWNTLKHKRKAKPTLIGPVDGGTGTIGSHVAKLILYTSLSLVCTGARSFSLDDNFRIKLNSLATVPLNHHGHRYYFMETPHWCFFAENCQQSLHTYARNLCETLYSLHETLLGHDLHGYWIKPWSHNTFYTSVFKPLQHYQTYSTQANPLSAPFKELWFLHC